MTSFSIGRRRRCSRAATSSTPNICTVCDAILAGELDFTARLPSQMSHGSHQSLTSGCDTDTLIQTCTTSLVRRRHAATLGTTVLDIHVCLRRSYFYAFAKGILFSGCPRVCA